MTPTPKTTIGDEKLEIRIFQDGNCWCALWGDNLQVGIVGFGKYINLAIEKFWIDLASNFMNLHENFSSKCIVDAFDILEEYMPAKEIEKFSGVNWQGLMAYYYLHKQNDSKE